MSRSRSGDRRRRRSYSDSSSSSSSRSRSRSPVASRGSYAGKPRSPPKFASDAQRAALNPQAPKEDKPASHHLRNHLALHNQMQAQLAQQAQPTMLHPHQMQYHLVGSRPVLQNRPKIVFCLCCKLFICFYITVTYLRLILYRWGKSNRGSGKLTKLKQIAARPAKPTPINNGAYSAAALATLGVQNGATAAPAYQSGLRPIHDGRVSDAFAASGRVAFSELPNAAHGDDV